MTVDVIVQGRLRGTMEIKNPRGKSYATFVMYAIDQKGASVRINCITFIGAVIEKICILEEGDSIAITGEISIGTWIGSDGIARQGLDVTVHTAKSAYHMAMGSRRKTPGQ
jgi:hypothetical protein